MSAPVTETDLQYPIGKWDFKPNMTAEHRAALIQQIEEAPAQFAAAIKGLSPAQLDTPYRPGGWTVRQLAHHVPDSHLNAYMRFKWALTEDNPQIKGYNEKEWAKTCEIEQTPVDVSLAILSSLHQRWLVLLRGMSDSDWQRTIEHSENGSMSLEKLLAIYSWHGRHHTAHITGLRKRNGW